MKRFFESGYNYIQDTVLEPGTYTFWARILSNFGDTFTFALANEANEWEVFDVDVEMGQWSKVYEVFTITEKKVKLDLIHRYYDSEQPVFVFKPQLIKGNIPTDAGASPYDIDQITDDLHDSINGIADFTNEEFADRVLSASERISLKRDMEAVETIFQSLKGSYEKLIINPFVPVAVITELTTKYNAVTSAKTDLFNVLNLIIAGDNIVTPEEITAKDAALLALNTALYNYNIAEKEIQNALGEDYTQKISAIRDFTDEEFADRMISETEKISLSHDLDSVQTLVDSVTSRFNEMLLNHFLTEADRNLLIEKYNALLDAWDWDESVDPAKQNGLKTVILNIINDPDNIIDPAEIAEKDLALSAFNIALGEFSQTEVYISKITIDYAIEQATFWSLNATSPVIYKDSKDAVTDGHHMPITVKGQLHRGTQIQDGGFITVTADDATEAAEATPSPVLIEPSDNDDKSLYTIRLYDSAAKTILLDTMTIPVVFRGANGKDAINITLSNEIDSVPASNDGVVSSYDNTGTDIRVFEGVTELTYDGVGTSPGTFKVTSLGIDLTVGQISSPTVGILKCVVGNISNLSADKGITQFTIIGKTLGNESFSEVKEQRVTKGKMGDPGEPGVDAVAPIIIDGFWAFWDEDTQTFIKSTFSAVGDDGHSPYVGANRNWYQWVPESGTYEDTGIKAEGDPGEDGEDGITISPNQQGYTYRADLNGDIIGSLANGMVELTITSGSTPITCPSSLSGGTPTTNGTYRVTRTLGNGITTNSSLSGGKYRITPATLTVDEASVELEIKIMMGGVVTSYPLTLTYRKQFDGADGKSTEFIFKGDTSDTIAPTLPSTSQQDDWYGQGTANEWNDDLVEPTKALPYVWASHRKKVDGVWGAFTIPKVWLRYAEDGDGITSTTIHYAKSSSGTTPPSSGWSTSLPSPTQGWYLWTRTTTTYKVAATTVSYSVSHWAEDGDGIVSTTIEYAKSSSGTAIPTTWSTSLPTPTKGWYLWTRTTTMYKISPTTVAYSISYWSEDGDSVVHIYKQYPTKPATPSSGVINPTGWSRNPDYILSIVSQTNWAINGKWHQSEELTATGNSTTSRITFTTAKDAQTITLELWADGHATYDYVYAGNLDTATSTSNYYDRVRGGRIIITYDVPTAGNHYIDIFWRKGISTIVGSNRGYYAIISDVKVWRSATNVIGGVAQDWSEPQQFFIDSALEERIYCLSKTTTAPAISDSDAYINDYIPLPCSLSSYRGDFTTYRAYSIGQVVIYQFEYYKVVKATTGASTRYPTDEEYFEKIPGWTDNPVGANKDYPFEFVAIRKKQSDGLWGTFVPSVWTKWAEDGDPGEPGKGVSSVVIWYYKSSSATTQTGGSWSTTKPDYSASFFLWTKVITTYTDNSATETAPSLDPDWHKVMAITDKFGVTTDGALIQAVMMLLRELNSLQETAGISGIQGTLKNNPAFWAGGTYTQAFALIQFLSKMSSGTTPTSGEYSNLAKITLLHNGAAKVGDFIIEPSGRIVMVDPATGMARLVFGVENIPTIATLLAGTVYSGSTAVGAGSTSSVQTLSGSTAVTKYGATATFNGTTISISASGKAQANGNSSFAVAELYAYCNGVKTLALATAMIYFTNTVNYQSDVKTVVVPVTSLYLTDAGTYTFKLEVITEGDISYAQGQCTASNFSWSYTLAGVRRQQYGLDGMMFFYSDSHFHFTEGEGLDARAPANKWNVPGVLLSASVASTGGFANSWGAKKHGSLTATKQTTGTYAVYHNVGHTNYQVSITPASNRTFYVTSKNTSYFMVYFYTNASTPALSDTAFDFMITGNNYSQ